jgi:hypothetical protein
MNIRNLMIIFAVGYFCVAILQMSVVEVEPNYYPTPVPIREYQENTRNEEVIRLQEQLAEVNRKYAHDKDAYKMLIEMSDNRNDDLQNQRDVLQVETDLLKEGNALQDDLIKTQRQELDRRESSFLYLEAACKSTIQSVEKAQDKVVDEYKVKIQELQGSTVNSKEITTGYIYKYRLYSNPNGKPDAGLMIYNHLPDDLSELPAMGVTTFAITAYQDSTIELLKYLKEYNPTGHINVAIIESINAFVK